MSGHSKWASIKHKKGATDAKRGKLFGKIIKEIQVAARLGGGDPAGNPRLRKALSTARSSQMPQDTITRAIKRGTGELEGMSFEEITYEGTGPGGTLFLVEAVTDNRNRSVAELRKVFEKHSGALGGGGSAMWAFERKGMVAVVEAAANEEQLMELTMEAGAEDVTLEGDSWQVLCEVSDIDSVTSAIEQADIEVETSAPIYVPKTKKALEGRNAEKVLKLYEALDDHDDVQNPYSDFDISDEEFERIAAL